MTRSFFRRREIADIVALGVNRLEKIGKRRAQIEAEPAAVADVEHPLDLDVELGAIPVFRFVRIVAESVGRSRFDSAHGHYPDSGCSSAVSDSRRIQLVE